MISNYTTVIVIKTALFWECKLLQPLRQPVWNVPRKLNIELPHNSAIPLLGICQDKTFLEKDLIVLKMGWEETRAIYQPHFPLKKMFPRAVGKRVLNGAG